MDVAFSDWNIEDHLKTTEERIAYIQAASEEGTPDALPDAFADVFRSLGQYAEADACENLAVYIRAFDKGKDRSSNGTVASQRELARA